jgi:hypothetical protein
MSEDKSEIVVTKTDRVTRAFIGSLVDASRERWHEPLPLYRRTRARANAVVDNVAIGYAFNTATKDEGSIDHGTLSDYIEGMIGLRVIDDEELDGIARHADLMVKILFALTVIYQRKAKDADGLYAYTSMSELLEELGYTRNGKKGFQSKSKDAVLRALVLVSKLQVDIIHRAYKTLAPLSGPAWNLNPVDRRGNEVGWDDKPVAIRFSPVGWYFRFNPTHVAALDTRYFGLTTGDHGRTAIFLGASLLIQSATETKKMSKRLKIRTLEVWAGIDDLYREDPGKRWKKLVAALTDLTEVGIIKDWERVSDDHVRIDYLHRNVDQNTLTRVRVASDLDA